MKTYKIPTRFVFDGTFYVKARNRAEAEEMAEKHCGMTTTRGIHTSLGEEVDWDFPVHPEKVIVSDKI